VQRDLKYPHAIVQFIEDLVCHCHSCLLSLVVFVSQIGIILTGMIVFLYIFLHHHVKPLLLLLLLLLLFTLLSQAVYCRPNAHVHYQNSIVLCLSMTNNSVIPTAQIRDYNMLCDLQVHLLAFVAPAALKSYSIYFVAGDLSPTFFPIAMIVIFERYSDN